MIAWLYKKIIGSFHMHEWETMDEYICNYDHESRRGTMDVKVLKCKKCGTWVKQKLY